MGIRHARHAAAIVAFIGGLVVASFAGLRDVPAGTAAKARCSPSRSPSRGCVLAVDHGVRRGARARCTAPLPVRWLAVAYIEVFRGTSALVQLFWLFFVLPHFGITARAVHRRVLALGLNVGAYGAEVVRGAITVRARAANGRRRPRST